MSDVTTSAPDTLPDLTGIEGAGEGFVGFDGNGGIWCYIGIRGDLGNDDRPWLYREHPEDDGDWATQEAAEAAGITRAVPVTDHTQCNQVVEFIRTQNTQLHAVADQVINFDPMNPAHLRAWAAQGLTIGHAPNSLPQAPDWAAVTAEAHDRRNNTIRATSLMVIDRAKAMEAHEVERQMQEAERTRAEEHAAQSVPGWGHMSASAQRALVDALVSFAGTHPEAEAPETDRSTDV